MTLIAAALADVQNGFAALIQNLNTRAKITYVDQVAAAVEAAEQQLLILGEITATRKLPALTASGFNILPDSGTLDDDDITPVFETRTDQTAKINNALALCQAAGIPYFIFDYRGATKRVHHTGLRHYSGVTIIGLAGGPVCDPYGDPEADDAPAIYYDYTWLGPVHDLDITVTMLGAGIEDDPRHDIGAFNLNIDYGIERCLPYASETRGTFTDNDGFCFGYSTKVRFGNIHCINARRHGVNFTGAIETRSGTSYEYPVSTQPSKDVRGRNATGWGSGDDGCTTHDLDGFYLEDCGGFFCRATWSFENSCGLEIDDASRNGVVNGVVAGDVHRALQIKGHRDSAAPYNITVIGTVYGRAVGRLIDATHLSHTTSAHLSPQARNWDMSGCKPHLVSLKDFGENPEEPGTALVSLRGIIVSAADNIAMPNDMTNLHVGNLPITQDLSNAACVQIFGNARGVTHGKVGGTGWEKFGYGLWLTPSAGYPDGVGRCEGHGGIEFDGGPDRAYYSQGGLHHEIWGLIWSKRYTTTGTFVAHRNTSDNPDVLTIFHGEVDGEGYESILQTDGVAQVKQGINPANHSGYRIRLFDKRKGSDNDAFGTIQLRATETGQSYGMDLRYGASIDEGPGLTLFGPLSATNPGGWNLYVTKDGVGNSVLNGSKDGVVTAESLRFTAGHILHSRTVTAAGAVTALVTDNTIVVNKTSGAATTVNLPTTGLTVGQEIVIKDGKGDAAANNITIDAGSGALIDAAQTSVISTNYGARRLVYSATNRWVVL